MTNCQFNGVIFITYYLSMGCSSGWDEIFQSINFDFEPTTVSIYYMGLACLSYILELTLIHGRREERIDIEF